MYDLVPDSTFSFKRGGEKSSKKCASRPLCATTDSTGHASRCIVRSGVQRGGHPGPYGPIATISDPGPFPGVGKGLTAGAPPCAAAGGGARAPRARSESLRNYGERRQPPLETLRNYGEDPRFRFS